MPLRETSPGVYEGTYTATAQDKGTVSAQAFLRLNNGQSLASPVHKVTFSESRASFSITNLRDGMTIAPVFNVQGQAQAGNTISVTVEYSSDNIVGALTGQLRTIRNQTVVGQSGFFDVPIDGSSIRAGQKFRLTVTDGQNAPIQMVLTRR